MKAMPFVVCLAVCSVTSVLPAQGQVGLVVDGKVPAGNVLVEKVEGDVVRLRQDLRDSSQDWFYWKFRVTGAAGRTLKFRFTKSAAVGSRGPAVSTDRGKTWTWGDDLQPSPRREAQTNDHGDSRAFDWTFVDGDDEVWFSQAIPYDASDWRAFLDRHAADRGRLFEEGVLCRSRKGRDVEYARFGRLDGKARYRIFAASRHHCEEISATYVLEGMLEQVFADTDLGRWLRENVEIRVVPFADKDGTVDGDQGKYRSPHDHARDYNEDRPVLYPEVRAIMKMLREWNPTVVNDYHSPWLRGNWFRKDDSNEYVYQVGLADPACWARQQAFGKAVERMQTSGVGYRQTDDFASGRGWNKTTNYSQGKTLAQWAMGVFTNAALVSCWEIPFANSRYRTLYPKDWRAFGRDVAAGYREYLEPAGGRACIDGVYPHLAMSNDEGECGTGAVVPWAGSLWAVTYGPHCPLGSSDKLYQITPDLNRTVRSESVGGTPADRLVHRETNQLLIGPYVIDAKGDVRVVPPTKMPGRLTGAARHLADPANLVYVATMDNGLYALDMNTLAVKTLQRDHNGVDGKIWGERRRAGFPSLPDWGQAVDNVLPGSHTKGMCSGFGRVQLANNGEYHPEARTNPWIPAGVLGDCAPDGADQRVIRRCQFTDISTRDGIYGNAHPDTNPIWSLGWDAKSVILAVTTNGCAWTYYRLPKASHCYDGAHGWNTEWPRIREAGIGDGCLLATMHGTFWRFPKDFSPARPNGIRPLSTYLKVIGDFCWWSDAPDGGSIVFGCDDHAKCEFLGKRKLKADQPKNARSTSNLWFVKPEDLTTFGPPTGEGWVWHGEDVKSGELSDPYLWEGYTEREVAVTDAAGRPVPHELVHEGDWVRVRALADAKGVKAHFVYGLPKPATLPPLDAARPYLEVTDDNGRTFRFPNVNGDANVICREVATERDLLYAGGVFYEVPAENAGGFRCLRPIALADEPVKSIAVDRGLVLVNGKRRVLDSLWKNGTVAQAYWLWRKTALSH